MFVCPGFKWNAKRLKWGIATCYEVLSEGILEEGKIAA